MQFCSSEDNLHAFETISILADDLTGASDACAPLALAFGSGRVCLSLGERVATKERTLLSFDGDLRKSTDATARETITAFTDMLRESGRIDGLVWLKIDSATRGHIARDVCLLLEALPQYRGAVVAPAYPANGRLFLEGKAVFVDGSRDMPSLRSAFEAAGEPVAVLSDLSHGADDIGQRIDAAFDDGARIVLADTMDQSDLEHLAPALVERHGSVLGVSSAGLIEAIAGSAGSETILPDQPLTCLFGTQSRMSRLQLNTFQRRGDAVRVSRTAAAWKSLAAASDSAAITAAVETEGARIFDILPQYDVMQTSDASGDLARVMAPLLDDLGIVLLSGGDTARAFLEQRGIENFDVIGVFEHGMPICRSDDLPYAFILKSGGFGDSETLLRLADFIQGSETETCQRLSQ